MIEAQKDITLNEMMARLRSECSIRDGTILNFVRCGDNLLEEEPRMSIDKDLLEGLMEGRSPDDLFGRTGILSELTKALAERALSTEMTIHFAEERSDDASAEDNLPPNRRNGRSQKTATTESGKVVLDIPRDRNSMFDPTANRQISASLSRVRPQDHQHVCPGHDDPRDPGAY